MTTTVTLKVDVADDGYHQTTTRKVEVHGLALDSIHAILEDAADELRRQPSLPLDAGDSDPSYVASVAELRAVPDDPTSDHCICPEAGADGEGAVTPGCPVHDDLVDEPDDEEGDDAS